MGAIDGRIVDLTGWELLRPKDFALLRHFGGDGLGLGSSRSNAAAALQEEQGLRHQFL